MLLEGRRSEEDRVRSQIHTPRKRRVLLGPAPEDGLDGEGVGMDTPSRRKEGTDTLQKPALGVYSSPVSQRKASASESAPILDYDPDDWLGTMTRPRQNYEPSAEDDIVANYHRDYVEKLNPQARVLYQELGPHQQREVRDAGYDEYVNKLRQERRRSNTETTERRGSSYSHQQQKSLATPTPKRKLDMEPTMTAEEQDLFGGPETKRRLVFGTPKSATHHQQPASVGTPSTIRASEPQTPATSRTQDSVAPTPQSSLAMKDPGSMDYSLTTNILNLLEQQYIDSTVSDQIRTTLNAHCLRVSGIEKGREATRKVLKTKDKRIEELENKVRELERQREVDKMVIVSIKKDISEQAAAGGSGRRGKR